MYDSKTNAGLLFNYFPKLMLISTKSVTSESDLLVKMSRILKEDQNITHDQQYFRNFRKNGFDGEAMSQYFGPELLEKAEQLTESVEPSHIGAWIIVKAIIDALNGSFEGEGELRTYCLFLNSHIDVEYQFIKENYGSKDLNRISAYLKDWLLVDGFYLAKPTSVEIYTIHMIMYWAALYELFLDVHMGSEDYSKLSKCLPVYAPKEDNIGFSPSTEVYLTHVKKGWARDRYQKDDIKWTELYADIARAQMRDPNILETPIKSDSLELIKPDTAKIKKRFDRWRKGELISMKELRQNIVILRAPYSESEGAPTLAFIFFINLFAYIQTELLKANVSPKIIVDEFAKYPEFKELVKDRFDRFKETGELTY